MILFYVLAILEFIEVVYAPLVPVTDFCFFNNVGVGGYTYLLEPLWWAGMVTSKYPTLSLSLSKMVGRIG
jgi:hypothetical protein